MEPIYERSFSVTAGDTDRHGRLKASRILWMLPEVAGDHSTLLGTDRESLMRKNLFWAVIRHRVQITRLPGKNEKITVQTWPMPTTRTAYPRSTVAYDEQGNECFRAITLWVLMDLHKRSMVLPGKSGIEVAGTLRGNELATPLGLPAKTMCNSRERYVNFTDLDRNGHMNNTRYLDWIYDLLPGQFHREHSIREFTLCYLNEALEGQQLTLSWDFPEEGCLQMDAHRLLEGKDERIFGAKILFD